MRIRTHVIIAIAAASLYARAASLILAAYIVGKSCPVLLEKAFWTSSAFSADVIPYQNYLVLGLAAFIVLNAIVVCSLQNDVIKETDDETKKAGVRMIGAVLPIVLLFASAVIFPFKSPRNATISKTFTKIVANAANVVAIFTIIAVMIKIFAPGKADCLMNYGLVALASIFVIAFVGSWLILCADRLFGRAPKHSVLENELTLTITRDPPVIITSPEKLFSTKEEFADETELMRYICTNWPLEDGSSRFKARTFVQDVEIKVGSEIKKYTIKEASSGHMPYLVVETEGSSLYIDKLEVGFSIYEADYSAIFPVIPFVDKRSSSQPRNYPPTDLNSSTTTRHNIGGPGGFAPPANVT